MSSPSNPPNSSRLLGRVTVIGMSLAVLALGGLSVWSAAITEREAAGLTGAGVQITGQLRAVQDLYVVRMETDTLEDDFTDEGVARLRTAIKALPYELARMKSGESPEAARVAEQAKPLANQLGPAVEQFLADPKSDINYHGDGEGDDTAEDAMETIISDLELLLNDSDSDPAQLLTAKLENINQASTAINNTAVILIPLGLLAVIVCGLLLSRYRRRADATMQIAMAAAALEARTDQLTGLPNRRALIEELHRRTATGESFIFALADLNGFKHYNDTFGHPAGDALLRRLGQKLENAWFGHGYAARLGGDEFCVITDNLAPDEMQALLHDALSDEGEGFSISSVSGLADVPVEATDPSSVLNLADHRLYAAKATFHGAKGSRGSRPVVSSSNWESNRAPVADDCDEHQYELRELGATTQLAAACAQALNLPADQVRTIERAAQLHDVGKAALPAAILTKQGALNDEEQRFIRRYTSIGERLLTHAEDLVPVAAIVRASQERWDGEGYPDQLAHEQIPIGSRIIAVATAFSAMTSHRPHASARSVEHALTELNRCSGTQFDPAVVRAFTQIAAAEPDARRVG